MQLVASLVTLCAVNVGAFQGNRPAFGWNQFCKSATRDGFRGTVLHGQRQRRDGGVSWEEGNDHVAFEPVATVEKRQKSNTRGKNRRGDSSDRQSRGDRSDSGGRRVGESQFSKRRQGGGRSPQERPIRGEQDRLDSSWDTIFGRDADNEDSLPRNGMAKSIDCEHFGKCSGCVVNSDVTELDIVRSARLYFRSSTVRKSFLGASEYDDLFRVVVPSSVRQWRTQAKLAVGAPEGGSVGKWGRGDNGCIFGLYARGTHNVLPIPDCVVHHPSINQAVSILTEATKAAGTVPYDPYNLEGQLRYVQLQVERSTGKVCLTLVWNGETIKDCQPALSRLVKELKRRGREQMSRANDKGDDEGGPNGGTFWHSIWCHTNNGLGNSIFARGSQKWHRLDGPEFVRELLPVDNMEEQDKEERPGLMYFSPLTFRQGNLDGFDVVARHVARQVPPGSKVCEMYAGVGVLGLSALSHHARQKTTSQQHENQAPLRWVRFSDENPANPRCFKRSVGSMPESVTGVKKSGNSPRRGGYGKRKGNDRQAELTLKDFMNQMSFGDDEELDERGRSNANGKKVSYTVASAGSAVLQGQALGADVVIVDPPRRGLDEELLVELCKPHNPRQDYVEEAQFLFQKGPAVNWVNDARTLIYVSCGFDSFSRDCDRLLASGGGANWKLASATGYVLFPGSNHIEIVAVFKR